MLQRLLSLNKTNDIFKRQNSSFHTNDVLSPSQGDGSLNHSLVNKDACTTFDDVIKMQRDSFLLEKMQQQHKLSMHRKTSQDRQSLDSLKRSQREESIKANRAKKKQLALQQQALSKQQ